MNAKKAIAIVVVVVAIAVAVYGPTWSAKAAASAKSSECDALLAQLRAVQTQGGDAVAAAKLETQLKVCAAAAKAAGADINLAEVYLATCESTAEQIEQEFAHYKSTDWSDLVKRGNTYGTILRLGDTLAPCAIDALNQCTSIAEVKSVDTFIRKQIAASTARAKCSARPGGSGCGENAGIRRGEMERILKPLEALVRTGGAVFQAYARVKPAVVATGTNSVFSGFTTAGGKTIAVTPAATQTPSGRVVVAPSKPGQA